MINNSTRLLKCAMMDMSSEELLELIEMTKKEKKSRNF